MARWTKGHSGNSKGRPKVGTAIAGLARSQLQKHRLIERLSRIGAGEDSNGNQIGWAGEMRHIPLSPGLTGANQEAEQERSKNQIRAHFPGWT